MAISLTAFTSSASAYAWTHRGPHNPRVPLMSRISIFQSTSQSAESKGILTVVMVYPFALHFLSVEFARRTGVVRWMPWYRHHNLPVGILTEIDGR